MGKNKPVPGLGARIRILVEELYDSNKTHAARKLDIAWSTLNDWMNEKVVPDIASIMPVAKVAGVHLDWLLAGEGPQYIDPERNKPLDAEGARRKELAEKAIEEYMASAYSEGISQEAVGLLRQFNFSTLGISQPSMSDVHLLRGIIEMQLKVGQRSPDGG